MANKVKLDVKELQSAKKELTQTHQDITAYMKLILNEAQAVKGAGIESAEIMAKVTAMAQKMEKSIQTAQSAYNISETAIDKYVTGMENIDH